MSRNGSGTYTLPTGNPVVTNTVISSTWANTTLTDLANAMTGSVAADGQTPMTGPLNLNSNKIANVTDPTLDQDAATKIYVDTANGGFLTKAGNLSDVANATTSRTNLVAAKSGANSDITSITSLTTPLTVAQGGIGVATLTANNVLLGNGTSAPLAVAPSTSGNVLTSNGTTWTSTALPSGGGVTSAVAGNGVAVSASTGAVTFSASCPSFNSVGSYVFIQGGTLGLTTTFNSGSNYAAGGGTGQLATSMLFWDGSAMQYVGLNTISGTWKWMNSSISDGQIWSTKTILSASFN